MAVSWRGIYTNTAMAVIPERPYFGMAFILTQPWRFLRLYEIGHDEACIGTTLTRGGVVFAAAYRAQHIGRRHGGYRLAIMDTLGVPMVSHMLGEIDEKIFRRKRTNRRQFALHFWSATMVIARTLRFEAGGKVALQR
ncbi:hypothetical protein Tco_0711046 [Tanacetum coccineum]